MGEQGIALEHDAEIPLVDGNLGEVLAIEEEGTPIGFNKTGDHPQVGCFPQPEGPKREMSLPSSMSRHRLLRIFFFPS